MRLILVNAFFTHYSASGTMVFFCIGGKKFVGDNTSVSYLRSFVGES